MSIYDSISRFVDSDAGNTTLKGVAGLLNGLNEDRRNKALAQAEIAKTQYGHLLGQGVADPNQYSQGNAFNRAIQGIAIGETENADRRRRQAELDAINSIKSAKNDNPYSAPARPQVEPQRQINIDVAPTTPSQLDSLPEILKSPEFKMDLAKDPTVRPQENPYVLQSTANNSGEQIMDSLASSMLGFDSKVPVYDKVDAPMDIFNRQQGTSPSMYAKSYANPYTGKPGSILFAGVK
jgi:hypothetical protein